MGLDPPVGAEPYVSLASRDVRHSHVLIQFNRLGIFYPRGATLGGSAQINAMNMALPPDSEWRDIAALTGDHTWMPDSIRSVYARLERNTYMPEGTAGYGFDGWLAVRANKLSHFANAFHQSTNYVLH